MFLHKNLLNKSLLIWVKFMFILKLILNLLLIYFYLKINGNYYIKELKISDTLCLILFSIFIILSFINYISVILNVILILLVTFTNYLFNYILPDKIKVNLNDSNIYIESKNSIFDILKDIKLKRLESILKRYNL